MPGHALRSEEDKIRLWMLGRVQEPHEICIACKKPLGEPSRCTQGYRYLHRCGKIHGRAVQRCELRVGECLLESIIEKAKRLKIKADAVPLDHRQIHRGLRKLHDPKNGWELFPEFQLHFRRVDLLAVRLYNSGPPLVAYEIKVDRGDFLSEIKNPSKRIEAQEFAAEFWLAAPEGLIQRDEVPEGCGLVEVRVGQRGALHPTVVVPSPTKPVTQIDVLFAARMIWRMRQQQGRR